MIRMSSRGNLTYTGNSSGKSGFMDLMVAKKLTLGGTINISSDLVMSVGDRITQLANSSLNTRTLKAETANGIDLIGNNRIGSVKGLTSRDSGNINLNTSGSLNLSGIYSTRNADIFIRAATIIVNDTKVQSTTSTDFAYFVVNADTITLAGILTGNSQTRLAMTANNGGFYATDSVHLEGFKRIAMSQGGRANLQLNLGLFGAGQEVLFDNEGALTVMGNNSSLKLLRVTSSGNMLVTAEINSSSLSILAEGEFRQSESSSLVTSGDATITSGSSSILGGTINAANLLVKTRKGSVSLTGSLRGDQVSFDIQGSLEGRQGTLTAGTLSLKSRNGVDLWGTRNYINNLGVINNSTSGNVEIKIQNEYFINNNITVRGGSFRIDGPRGYFNNVTTITVDSGFYSSWRRPIYNASFETSTTFGATQRYFFYD